MCLDFLKPAKIIEKHSQCYFWVLRGKCFCNALRYSLKCIELDKVWMKMNQKGVLFEK